MNEIRPLTADDVEVRVGTVGQNKNGGYMTMLLYKNARVDMQILDEVYGSENWQRVHKEINGSIYCGVGIWDGTKGMWVWKWDCGSESNTEKEKGAASDSFKRACFNVGIGRELYNSPFIFLPVAVKPKKNGYGYELNDPSEVRGIKVSEMIVEEVNGKRYVSSLSLTQGGKLLQTFTNKEI